MANEIETVASDASARMTSIYEALVRSAPEYMFVLNECGDVDFANRANHPWQDASGGVALPKAVRDAIERVLRTGAPEQVSVCATHAAGETRWYRASLVRMEFGGGRSSVLVFMSDDTDCQQVNEALRVTVRELEESKRQALQAQKMESIGRLAGGVAHDFNNLLTAIISYSRFVMDDLAPSDPRRSDLAEVLKAADSAARLTSQLLAFSRKRPVEPVLMDLNAAVARVLGVLRRTLDSTVELNVIESPAPVFVMFDPVQFDHLLLNLAVNGRDAMMGRGTLTIKVGTRRVDRHRELAPGEYALLSVTDTGSGMTDDVLSQVFEPFFSTKGDKGTGLGLSTCYGIVAQAHGHIEVETSLGVGTTFTVLLPLASGAGDSTKGETPNPQGRLAGLAVVVEDQAAIRKSMVRSLQNVGFNVIDASTAEEALGLVQDLGARVDLLVTDVVLPGMSGYALAERLRERQPELPVLLCSGYTGRGHSHTLLTDDRTSFMGKPFAGDELVSKVRALMDSCKRAPSR